METTILQLTAELPTDEAWAFAQFLKRLRFDTAREYAANEEEAYLITSAAEHLRKALAEQGLAPR